MSIAATIKKKGQQITWFKHSGSAYDPVTRTVQSISTTGTTIYAIVDGFGSIASTLRSMVGDDQLTVGGDLRLYTVSNLRFGERVVVDGVTYTVKHGKSVKTKNEVLYVVDVTE